MTTQITRDYRSNVGVVLTAIVNLPYGPVSESVQMQLEVAARHWAADPLFATNKYAIARGLVDEAAMMKAKLAADFKDHSGYTHNKACGVLWALDKAIGPDGGNEKHRRTLVNTACDYLEYHLGVVVPEWIFQDGRIRHADGRATLIAQDIKQWLQNYHYDTVLAQADACSHNHVEAQNG